MSRVYYQKYDGNQPDVLSQLARHLFEHIVDAEQVQLEKHVPIKVHFGEKGNTTFVPPGSYEGLIDALEDRKIEASYIETNVLYRGARTNRTDHLKLAKEHGFTQIPIIIADGEIGEEVHEVTINKDFFDTVKLGKAFGDFKQVLVTAHFKGHGMAGFGGALKQLAMGFASRSGKMAQHSQLSPTVDGRVCINCGLCLTKCDVDAIEMNDHAEIIQSKCVGCAGCIAICPVSAITNDWRAAHLKEKISEYAYGACKDKNHIFINFLMNITEQCDCMGQHYDPIAGHIGVLASMDPVALDAACLDMLQDQENKTLFDSGRVSLDHAEKIGLGTTNYTLVEVK